MPNHVRNILTFEAEGEILHRILDDIKNDEKGIGSIDFNKLIPMPPELNIEKGSRTSEGCKLYENITDRIINIKQRMGNPSITADEYIACEIEAKNIKEEFNNMPDDQKEMFNLGKQYFANVNNYGYGDWYDWSVANWGTKWNAYDFAHYNNTIEFNTAWECPEPIIQAISEKYPDITINHKWADEDMGTNLGEREYIKGDKIYQHQPDSFSKDAYDLAFEIWEETPEDLGLKLSADGTEYVSDDDEENDSDTPLLLCENDESEDDEIEE